MALDLNLGNAVTGTQRFSRPELEGRFMRALDSSAGIKMFGLRRIGKSTMRLYATEQLDEQKRPYAYFDAQGLHSLGDLLGRLSQTLPAENGIIGRTISLLSSSPAQAALEAISKGAEKEEALISAYWRVVSDAIVDALKKDTAKPVLVIDEFSYLIKNMIERDSRKDAEKLLASMREWRGAGMKMILCGSIGMVKLAKEHNLSLEHLNDMRRFTIPELTENEAREFVRQATEGPSNGQWTDEHTSEFLRQTNVFYPCFLVCGLIEVGISCPARPEDFARIFSEKVRPDLHQDFYLQFDRRFKSYVSMSNGERENLILPMLKFVMDAGEPCSIEGFVNAVSGSHLEVSLALHMLVEDGFLVFTEDTEGVCLWKPASRLVTAWWKRANLS